MVSGMVKGEVALMGRVMAFGMLSPVLPLTPFDASPAKLSVAEVTLGSKE